MFMRKSHGEFLWMSIFVEVGRNKELTYMTRREVWYDNEK